jgi:hypothetical protein
MPMVARLRTTTFAHGAGMDDHCHVRYFVDKAVIDALVTAAVRWSEETPGDFSDHWHHGSRRVNTAAATTIGQMLWYANW